MKEFAKIIDVKEGTAIVLDGGFTCCKDGDHRVVKSDNGQLYFDCSEGQHFLDGQENGDVLTGIYLQQEG